jgi:trypsin
MMMVKRLSLAAVLVIAVGCGRATQESDVQVVGGEEVTDPNAYPWMVSIQSSIYGHFCGGTLVAPKVVLTAAHCVKPAIHEKVRIGAHDLSKPEQGEEIKIVDAKFHEGYSDTTMSNDIAVLILEKPATKTPLLLNQAEDFPSVNDNAEVIGWGVTQEGGTTLPTILRGVTLPVRDVNDCKQDLVSMEEELRGEFGPDFEVDGLAINESVICAGPKEGGKDSCQGDSGGPLFSKTSSGKVELTGVVSYGIGCARKNLSGLYTRVSYFQSWIDERLNENL